MAANKKNTKDVNKTFDASKYLNTGLPLEEIEEIKESFDLFLNENESSIMVKDLVSAMESLGYDKKSPVVYKMIASLEDDEEGEITFETFLDLMTGRISKVNPKNDLERVFKLFDDEHKGLITLDNLKRVAKELGEDISEEELKEIIARGSINNENKDGILLEDFIEIMSKK